MYRSTIGLALHLNQHKLSAFVTVLAYFLLILPATARAQNFENECQEKLSKMQLFQLDVLQSIRTETTTPSYKNFMINGEAYKPIQLLGYSRARVYLATDSLGRSVIIKDYNLKTLGHESREQNLFNRELELTAFLIDEGIDVPHILLVDKENGWIVKEYVEGLLFQELHTRAQLFGFSSEDIQTIKNAFDEMPTQLAIVNKKISSNPHFRQFDPHHLDFKVDNFIYSLRKQKWILFDP